jgi:hypothetical protein
MIVLHNDSTTKGGAGEPPRRRNFANGEGGNVSIIEASMEQHTRDHIIFFMAQKMYFLEKGGNLEVFNRLVEHFEQINLDQLLEYLTRYYGIDVERELDDFFLAEGELVFISRRRGRRFKHVYRDGHLRLVGIDVDKA